MIYMYITCPLLFRSNTTAFVPTCTTAEIMSETLVACIYMYVTTTISFMAYSCIGTMFAVPKLIIYILYNLITRPILP